MLLVCPAARIKLHVLLSCLVGDLFALYLLRLIVLGRQVFGDLFEGHRGLLNGWEARARLRLLLFLDVDNLVLAIDFTEIIAKNIDIIMRFLLVHKSLLFLNLLIFTEAAHPLKIVLVHDILTFLELLLQHDLTIHVRLHHARWQKYSFSVTIWLLALVVKLAGRKLLLTRLHFNFNFSNILCYMERKTNTIKNSRIRLRTQLINILISNSN